MPEDYIGIEFTSYKTAPVTPVLFFFTQPPPTDAARYRYLFFIVSAVRYTPKAYLGQSQILDEWSFGLEKHLEILVPTR